MHSSRMRTGHSLTVCCSLLPGGGGVCLVGGVSAWSGGCLPGLGGCLPGQGVSAWSGGCLPGLGGCLPGLGGFSLPGGACPETPPVNRITHMCKNIILATASLRLVIRWIPGEGFTPQAAFKEGSRSQTDD